MGASRPGRRTPDSEQATRDLFDYVRTLTPGEALNAIGHLSDHWSGPRVTVAIKVQPIPTAVTLAIVLATISELAKRVHSAVEIRPADYETTGQLSELLRRALHDAVMGA